MWFTTLIVFAKFYIQFFLLHIGSHMLCHITSLSCYRMSIEVTGPNLKSPTNRKKKLLFSVFNTETRHIYSVFFYCQQKQMETEPIQKRKKTKRIFTLIVFLETDNIFVKNKKNTIKNIFCWKFEIFYSIRC